MKFAPNTVEYIGGIVMPTGGGTNWLGSNSYLPSTVFSRQFDNFSFFC
jgi:hypothetical protein